MEGTSQECSRSTLGMDIFLSQHKGFRGKIKTYPEDFRVTEVDLCGKSVRLQREEADDTSSPSDNSIDIRQSEERKPGEEIEKVLNPSTRTEDTSSPSDNPIDIRQSEERKSGEEVDRVLNPLTRTEDTSSPSDNSIDIRQSEERKSGEEVDRVLNPLTRTEDTSSPSDNTIDIRQSEERKPGKEVDKVLTPSTSTEEHPSACTSSTDERLIFDELTDFGEMASTLQKVVGHEAMDGLKTFSKQEFDRNEQVCSSDTPITSEVRDGQALNSKVVPVETPSDDFASGFNLGEISGKDERTFTHKAVQCLYPHLKTSATRQAGDAFHAVQVFTNPIYWEFRKLLSNHQTESVVRFACSKFSTTTVSVGASLTKKQRTSLHGMISKHFGKFQESKTCDRAGMQEVVIRFRERYSQKGQGRGVKRKGSTTGEPASGDVYTGFTLRKENLEVLDALQQLGRVLKVQTAGFSYAGIKDKKAVTLQSVAVKGVNQKRFHQLINDGRFRGITVGNVQPLTKAIHLGDLTGNSFDILIRDVHVHDTDQHQQEEDEALLWQELDSCFKHIQERGFVNYFGEQRFGQSCNGESQSAAIGQAILAGKYRQAIDLILAPDGERNDSANIAKRHFHETHNAKEALALMPKNKTRECIILKALHRHGLDRDGCVRALYCIPHGLRQFYIHAFCSLVWNHMASERLRLYGCKVVAGDLVLAGSDKRGTRDKIQEVSEDEVQNGVFSIQDVALPMPGNSIRYPGNRVGGAYKEYMEKVDLGLCTYRVTDLQVNIPGDYRRLIRRPKDLHWELERSGESSGQLVRSDGVVLDTDRATKNGSRCQDNECWFDVDSNTNKNPTLHSDLNGSSRAMDTDNPKSISENLPVTDSSPLTIKPDFSEKRDSHFTSSTRNLRIKFKLPTSTYATVFLRELMKR